MGASCQAGRGTRGKGQAPAVPLADSDDYEIQLGTAEQAPDGKSFQQETRLIFTPSVQRDQGAQYICRVQHVALEQPVEKSSAELQVTGLPWPVEEPQISESEPKDETDEPQRREETEPEQKPSLNSSGPQKPRGPLPPLEVPDISRNHFTSSRPKDETDEPQRREETELEQKPSLNSSGPQQPRDLLQPPKMPGTSGRVTSLRQISSELGDRCPRSTCCPTHTTRRKCSLLSA
ncbi:hypothetical protein Y1Q_0014054 [Alligator mississippiensis]|uniref:Uncharacterized protein n=1 Tax=Alligator mississippiensis TaxID=8496 RepID=A0A151MW56_ALLMI|nr:hypothetical protein Y1Q_0014054 [Alligator mississippiensis]